RPVGRTDILDRHAFGLRRLPRRFSIVPGGDIGAAGHQRPGRRDAAAAETKDGDAAAGKGRDGDHLSFRLDRPISASTTAMIQKRMTICGSVQPICSKWWWIGAILKTRLPVSRKETTWTITEIASSTKRPPTMAR